MAQGMKTTINTFGPNAGNKNFVLHCADPRLCLANISKEASLTADKSISEKAKLLNSKIKSTNPEL